MTEKRGASATLATPPLAQAAQDVPRTGHRQLRQPAIGDQPQRVAFQLQPPPPFFADLDVLGDQQLPQPRDLGVALGKLAQQLLAVGALSHRRRVYPRGSDEQRGRPVGHPPCFVYLFLLDTDEVGFPVAGDVPERPVRARTEAAEDLRPGEATAVAGAEHVAVLSAAGTLEGDDVSLPVAAEIVDVELGTAHFAEHLFPARDPGAGSGPEHVAALAGPFGLQGDHIRFPVAGHVSELHVARVAHATHDLFPTGDTGAAAGPQHVPEIAASFRLGGDDVLFAVAVYIADCHVIRGAHPGKDRFPARDPRPGAGPEHVAVFTAPFILDGDDVVFPIARQVSEFETASGGHAAEDLTPAGDAGAAAGPQHVAVFAAAFFLDGEDVGFSVTGHVADDHCLCCAHAAEHLFPARDPASGAGPEHVPVLHR